jgi:DNA invertase Pin-like site-specific DNA recombinase
MIFCYCRVSTVEQVDGTSLDEQERRCRLVAQLRSAGAYDVAVFRDAGVSGGIPLPERPAGKEMLSSIKSGDIVIASKLDRMFRSALDALSMLELFKVKKVDLILSDLSSDPITGGGVGQLMFGILAQFADFEKQRINTRTQEGRRAKRAKGGHVAGAAPYGYRVEGQGRAAMLVPDEVEQKAVQLICDWWKRGFRAGTIRRVVWQHGCRPREGEMFHMTQIKRIAEYQERLRDAAGTA